MQVQGHDPSPASHSQPLCLLECKKKPKIPLGGIYKSIDENVSILPGDMMLRINIPMW